MLQKLQLQVVGFVANVVSDGNDAVDVVVTKAILSHLQHLVDVKMRLVVGKIGSKFGNGKR